MTTDNQFERLRVEAVRKYNESDTSSTHDLQDLIEVASDVCGTPMAFITLIDNANQYFKVKKGVDWVCTSKEESICRYTILQKDVMIVEDTLLDGRFADNPLLNSAHGIRFYAGAPLTTPEGYCIGSLCVASTQPQTLDPFQISCLEKLASLAMERLESCLNKPMNQVNEEESAE